MTIRDALAVLAAALPDDACVPVPALLLRSLLQPSVPPMTQEVAADLSVARTAAVLGWKPSTIRQWAEQGRFPGAYKLSGAWRIPPAAIDAFQLAAAARGTCRPTPATGRPSATPAFDAALRTRRGCRPARRGTPA